MGNLKYNDPAFEYRKYVFLSISEIEGVYAGKEFCLMENELEAKVLNLVESFLKKCLEKGVGYTSLFIFNEDCYKLFNTDILSQRNLKIEYMSPSERRQMILFLMRTSGRFYFFDPINGNSLKSSNDGKSILLNFFNDFDFFDILNSDIKIYYSSNEEFIKGVVKKIIQSLLQRMKK